MTVPQLQPFQLVVEVEIDGESIGRVDVINTDTAHEGILSINYFGTRTFNENDVHDCKIKYPNGDRMKCNIYIIKMSADMVLPDKHCVEICCGTIVWC